MILYKPTEAKSAGIQSEKTK
jgi:hypothetical protein